MNIDLNNLKEIGSSKSIKKNIDLPDLQYHNQEIETPYLFDLDITIYNTQDLYILSGNLSGNLILVCTRCLEKFEYRITIDIEEELLKEDIVDAKNIDLSKILIENIILSLPMKHLCSEECKGLCTVCGQNLNEEECDCDTEMVDPRLAKLKDFYKSDDNEE
ncbi:MAG: YceD family protein [Halanaerobiales bacterium]